MSAPKSVTKVTYANGHAVVTYTNAVETKEYQMFELCRGALRDVTKFIQMKFAENIMREFKSLSTTLTKSGKEKPNTSAMKKQIKGHVWSGKSTKYPRVEIGLHPDVNTGFNTLWQEIGSSKTQRKGILTNTVKDNVSTIIDIESQYLTYLQKNDSEIQSVIDEESEEVDEN